MSVSKTSEESLEPILLEIADRLRRRAPEIKKALITRFHDLSESLEVTAEIEYLVPTTANEVVDYMISAIEQGESWQLSLPPTVLTMLRQAARDGVPLDEMLRIYSGCYNLMSEFLTQEVVHVPRETLRYMLAVQNQYADRMISAVSAEYLSETERLDRSPTRRLAERVQQLLAGMPADTDGLGYDLDDWHIGLIGVGAKVDLVVRGLAEKLGCKPLVVPRGADTVWAWLGARRSIPFTELERHSSSTSAPPVSLAVGESRRGLEGWRMTHREAQLALTVMLREPGPLIRCTDVLLPAAVMRDDATARFLLDAYLGPLDRRKDADVLKQTLRTYFDLGGNAASAAASLGVDRHTVQRRLRRAEESIGRPLDTCRAELEVALRVEQFGSRDSSGQRMA